MCVEALDVCSLAAGGANVPRWLGRQLFASDDFLLEQRWCVCPAAHNSPLTAHARADCAVCAHADLYGLDTQRTVSNAP